MTTTDIVGLFNVLAQRALRVGVRPYRTSRSKHMFTQHELLSMLALRVACKTISYRMLRMLAPLVLGKEMHDTTPLKAAKRFGAKTMHALMIACLPVMRGRVLSIDSTGFCVSKRSSYYDVRIGEDNTRRGFVKVSLLVDTSTTAVLAAQVHVLHRHDLRDVRKLITHAKGAKHLVADKAYDAEWFHELLHELGLQAHIPLKARTRKGFWRKKHAKMFSQPIFGKRNIGETTNSVVKRRSGSTVAAKNIVAIRCEILMKLAVHNLMLCIRKTYYLMISA